MVPAKLTPAGPDTAVLDGSPEARTSVDVLSTAILEANEVVGDNEDETGPWLEVAADPHDVMKPTIEATANIWRYFVNIAPDLRLLSILHPS